MESTHFDHLTRAISASTSRRVLLERFSAAGALAALARFGIGPDRADARKKHKKKRRCPKDRRCGKKRCCKRGQICAGNVCVTGQGTCSPGADTCQAGVPVLCGANCVCVTSTEGQTRCAQGGVSSACGTCTSSSDCAAFGAGAFCFVAGIGCGCRAAEGMCATPCVG